MKKQILLVSLISISILLLVAGCGKASSSVNGDNNSEGEGMEDVHLKMTASSFQPFRYADTDGSYIGYDFDVLDELSEMLGFTYEFTEIEFAGTIASITTGESDFAGTLTETDERKQTLDFTEAYYRPKAGIGVAKGSDIQKYEDLVGKKITAPFGTTHQDIAESIEGTEVTAMDSLVPAVQDVVAGRADAIMGDSVQVKVYAEEGGLDFYVLDESKTKELSSYHFAFAKNSPYIEHFNKGIQELKENGKLEELQKKWLGEENITKEWD